MALTKCKECGEVVSTKADACPKCGAKRPKGTSIGTWLIGGFFALVVYQCTLGTVQRDAGSGTAPSSASSGSSSAGTTTARRSDTPVTLPSLASGNHEAFCKDNWTTRGALDSRMYSHCVEQEREGYYNLQELVQKHSSVPYISDVVDAAIAKWSSRGQRQDRMVHHSVKQEIEGYLDLVYEAGKPSYDKSRFESCSRKWGMQYRMVAHCYKKQ